MARLGARARHPARMAGGGDPRRDHAQAVPARGDRRDRRGADHLHPRGAPIRAATGTIATAGSATPITRCRRSTGSARSTCWKDISPTCGTSSTRRSGGQIQPLYAVSGEPKLDEGEAEGLAGYRGMGPVRVGNAAYTQVQHDAYGQIVLSNAQAFFDERLFRMATREDFAALERVGERAWAMHDQPDAGLWEFRTRTSRPHLQRGDVLGRLRPARQRRRRARARRARGALARAGRRDPRDDRARGLARGGAALRRDLRRRRARRQPAAARRHALPRARRSALPRHASRRSRRACGAASTCCATPPRTISACPRPRSTSAPSG